MRHGCFKTPLQIEQQDDAFEALKQNVRYGKAWWCDQKILLSRNLDHALHLFGYSIRSGYLEFLGGRDAQQDRLFHVLAPYISTGVLTIDDGEFYHEYYFDGSKCRPYMTQNKEGR